MANVYLMREDGGTEALERIHCRDEERELQQLLERNPNLIPGDQVNPEDPRRWLLVKREMPVPDPSTGEDRWSIDFFFVDQEATPTFVECKRFSDTRSRREVVGQVLEYAANGHYYWTKELLRGFAEEAAGRRDQELGAAVAALGGEEAGVDAFFDRVEQNLREGQVRLIFFMEDSPMELRSVVDFLNKQMERSEVLLVEARQYRQRDQRIVVPTVFGYTEQARMVKRTVTVRTPGQRRRWDEESFFADASRRLDESQLKALRQLYEFARQEAKEVTWGTGAVTGSFTPLWSAIGGNGLFNAFSDGRLWIGFGGLSGHPDLQDKLRSTLEQVLGVEFSDDFRGKWPSVAIDVWAPRVTDLVDAIRKLTS